MYGITMRVIATFTVHANLVITKLMFVFLTTGWRTKNLPAVS